MNEGKLIDKFAAAFAEEVFTPDELKEFLNCSVSAMISTFSEEAFDLVNHIEFDTVHSYKPELFRKVLPSLLLGLEMRLKEQDNPVTDSILSDLVDYTKSSMWDNHFLQRWGHFDEEQLILIRRSVESLTDLIGQVNAQRALQTLELLQIRQSLGSLSDS